MSTTIYGPQINPLTIGSITLNQNPFEGPNGDENGLNDLGSKQKSVVYEFAGGEMSAQLYGSFPKPISWKGKLIGSNAITRSFQLQKLCDNGDDVTLIWGQWNFDGFVEDYEVTARGPNEIDYKIVFKPLANNSTVTGGNPSPNNDPFAGTVANAQSTATQQAIAPASGATLPLAVQQGVTSLNQGINQALQQSGGSVVNIPASTLGSLQGQISSIQDILQPIINGSDPIASSAAADLSGTLATINTAFNDSVNPIITTLQVVNPNLYQLAAQYYGSPLLYGVIQSANGLSDPLPTTNGPIPLIIPVPPIVTSITPPTVMTDALANAA